MKSITKSLLMITAVAALAIGGTVAYFFDTETSTGNSFTAGTIDIAVGNQNPWSNNAFYNIKDLKPGESGNINLNVSNVGTNPVDITKKLTGLIGNGGTGVDCKTYVSTWHGQGSSEPECSEVQSGNASNDIQNKVSYTLAVEVYNHDGIKIWWQEIYKGIPLTSVYGGDKPAVDLGMIPVGGHMLVNQNYKLDENTDNQYQGDGFTFNMELVGNQLAQEDGYNTVTLDNKTGAPDWQIINDGVVQGTLNYKTTGPAFSYNFTGTVNTLGTYDLVYVGSSGNYPYSGSILLGTGTASSDNKITISGNPITGNITNGKVWLVPSASYPSGWDQANTLFETALINYTQN